MKKFNFLWMFFLCLFLLEGCKNEDLIFSVDALKNRLTELDKQVNAFNENLKVLSYVFDSNNKTISSVVKSEDGKSYVITLSDETVLNVTIGSELVVKQPEVTIDEETKCWVINGVLTDKKAVGDDGDYGSLPQFKFMDNKWWVDLGDGNWKEVTGGTASSSESDGLFLDVEVEDNILKLTLGDGTVCRLPIVADLKCAFNNDDTEGLDEGFYEITIGATREFDVKIEGDPEVLSPIYPLGWYAELNQKETVDENGYNYTLKLSAQYFNTFVSRSVSGDNLSDVSIRVRKGSFWAVDKIKVKMMREKGNFWENFKDGYDIEINNFEFNKDYLSITDGDIHTINGTANITEGGVYFYENDADITCNITEQIDHLVILPKTEGLSAKLKVEQSLNIAKTFVIKDLKVLSPDNANFLQTKGANMNISVHRCNISDLDPTKKFCVGTSGQNYSVDYFGVYDSDFVFSTDSYWNGNGQKIFSGMDCVTFEFVNNICYNKSEFQINHFKIIDNDLKKSVDNLIFKNNTIIDLEGANAASNYGLLNVKDIVIKGDIYSNLYYITTASNNNNSLIRLPGQSTSTEVFGDDNMAYSISSTSSNGKTNLMIGYTKPNSLKEWIKDINFFDLEKGAEIDKVNGRFKPVSNYSNLGAQR